jgi:hypothetical protein
MVAPWCVLVFAALLAQPAAIAAESVGVPILLYHPGATRIFQIHALNIGFGPV